MTETVQLALVAVFPVIVTQLVTAYIAYRGQLQQNAKLDSITNKSTTQDEKLNQIVFKTDKGDEKLDQIHTQTNSNLTEQKALIQKLQDQINQLMVEKGKADEREGKK
jgi:hypothetical protein